MNRRRYLSMLKPFERTTRKRAVLNPTLPPQRTEPDQSVITKYRYGPEQFHKASTESLDEVLEMGDQKHICWINIDGLRKDEVEKAGNRLGIHPLLVEDILSIGQRAKMDEMNGIIYVLLQMLYFNEKSMSVESEQVSLVLGKNWVISFQEDPSKDVFNPVREKIKHAGSKLRASSADYLFYSLIDIIVDNYFLVVERLAEKIDVLEENIIHVANTRTLARISYLRKEILFLKRSISPVREMVNGILRSESPLIRKTTGKYFKDVYDHIVQANELVENYRDTMLNLQDLYLSQVNLKMNEVMKVMAVVTCLLAPATVIGGIFGMNFSVIPFSDNHFGFYLAVGFMLLVPIGMLWIFIKRGWF